MRGGRDGREVVVEFGVVEMGEVVRDGVMVVVIVEKVHGVGRAWEPEEEVDEEDGRDG
jgi:hypothetical protein